MLETRNYELDLEVRDVANERVICGICVPYGVEQRIHAGLTEVFIPGAFNAVTRAAHRVKLLLGHDAKALPLGRAQLLREDSAGLYGEFRISKGSRNDDVLELVVDGALNQLSVGFMPLKDRRRPDGVVERVKAHLAEVSLVTFGAYGEAAALTAVRDELENPNLEAAKALIAKLAK
jgi:HK97 family phage prohead protease